MLRFSLAKLAGQLILWLLKLQNKGGTALPGLVALKVDPQFVQKSSSKLNTILITGTNGKTTTSRLIASILAEAKLKVIHNRAGSNLLRGVASTLLSQDKADGAKSDNERAGETVAIFECDEAAFPEIAQQTQPKTVLIMNLFRDQMDRYGEIDTTLKKWVVALENLPKDTKVILNVDDPSLGYIAYQIPKIINFGLDDPSLDIKKLPHTADAAFSPESGEGLTYSTIFLSHLGIYHDPKTKFARPHLDVSVDKIKETSIDGSQFELRSVSQKIELKTYLPGIFNLYNVTAAATVALELGIDPDLIKRAVLEFKSAFGRFEVINVDGKKLVLTLIKNPVGFDQVIDLIKKEKGESTLIIGINDNLADGTDVSWLWDADVEELASHQGTVITTGLRAHEMALRLKYANFPASRLQTINDLNALFEHVAKSHDKKYYFMLTYTAMLEVRGLLAQRDLVKPFFEDWS